MSSEASLKQPIVAKLDERAEYSRSFWRDALFHLIRDRLTIISLGVLVLLTLASLFLPPLVERTLGIDANRTNVAIRYLPPGEKCQNTPQGEKCTLYILGTDQLGRDQFVRLLYGGRVSLGIAYSASLMSISIGVLIGVIAGYYGGWIDDIVIWFITTLNSVPAIFLLLIASSIWSPSPEVLVVILSLLGWIGTARLVRGEVISLRERDYVEAAHALGAPPWRLIAVHIFPNLLSLVIINLTINAGVLILVESGLSFLGLGVQPPTPTWGNMLTDSRSYFVKGVHLVIWPGLLISITVLCFYLLGDGLRDALDPRSRK